MRCWTTVWVLKRIKKWELIFFVIKNISEHPDLWVEWCFDLGSSPCSFPAAAVTVLRIQGVKTAQWIILLFWVSQVWDRSLS